MKSSRNYPVYTVNKHAEGLLVGGHPWVYENDILSSGELRMSFSYTQGCTKTTS